MMQFDLFTDSSANIPDPLIAARDIRVIPYTYLSGETEALCYSQEIPFRELARRHYQRMRAGEEFKTSLISKERFLSALTPSLEAGRDVFLITIASGISGSYQQALAAKKELEAAFPARKIVVTDSVNASMGEGLLVLRVADLRDMGESIDACAEWFEQNRYKVNSYLTVGDLRYLRRGGRISAAVAIAGTLLGIKPILRADGEKNAKIVFFDRARGRKRALAALLDAFDKNVRSPETQTVAITHADCEEDALYLAEELKTRGVQDVIVEYYDVCSGTHVGPDTVALFFWGTDRRGQEKPEKAPAGRRAPANAKV